MASSDMNFLSDLIPSAVIKVLTIETIGGTVELETNPHIVEETVPVYKRAALQATMGASGGAAMEALLKGLGGSLATTTWSGAELGALGNEMGMGTSNKETTMVTLDVAIKDTLDREDTAGQWFMSGDITKYLYIFAVQFKTKRAVDVYKALVAKATGPVMQIAHAYLGGSISKNELLAQAQLLKIPGVGNLIKSKNDISAKITSVQDIINEIDSSTSGQAVTEQDLMLAGFSSIDTNGDTIYEFPAKFQFEINSSTPAHAAYYVCSFINIEQLLEDNGLTTNTVNMTSNQFANNGVWITALSNGELNGDSRISDFRDVNNVVPAHSVDLSQINMLDEMASGTAQNFTTLPAYKHKYFSDVHLSTLPSRECGFLFGFSQLDFMKDNSVFGRFFDNVADEIADEVLKKCAIEEIKIIRRRVKHFKQGAYARGYPSVYEPWDNTQVDHTVVSSKAKKRTGKLQSAQRTIKKKDGGPARKGLTLSGGIRELSLKTKSSNGSDFRIRHFTGKDAGVKHRTDGIYQYGVEITIRDYVPVYIGKRLAVLKKHVARLKEYEVFSSIPVVNRYKQTYADPHVGNKRVDQQSGKAIPVVNILGGETIANTNVSTKTQVGFYDPTINKFTQDFVRFAGRKYGRTQPWVQAPRALVELLDIIVNEKMTPEAKDKIRKNMTGVCNPSSGTPRGINAAIESLEAYVKIVEDLISAEPATGKSGGASNPSTPHGGSGVTNKTVTYKTYFNNIAFNADEMPSTGATFLNMSAEGTSTSIGMVSTSDYIARANLEVLKYFTSPTGAPATEASFKALSAMNVNVLSPENTVNLQTVRNRYDGADRSEMAKSFKSIVQYMGSKRKADQTRILTVDSKQRIGQAITPEFGFSIMTGKEYGNALRGRREVSGVTNPRLSTGGDEGDSAAPTQSPGSTSLPIPIQEEQEIDYVDVFPSAMASAEWSAKQTGAELMDAFTNIAAGYETEDEATFLTQMLINTKRDFLHSTKHHPARSEEANFTPIGIIEWLLAESIAAGGFDTAAWEAAALRILSGMPISIQAAGLSVAGSSAVRSNIKDRMGAEYWNDPIYNVLYQLYFMLNVRVEYLVGYRDSNLQPKYTKTIGSEIWAPLTGTKVKSLHKAEGQQILCRLRPYNNEAVRIAFPKALSMPIWNSKFLLVGNNGKPLSGIKRKMGFVSPATQHIREGLGY
jgi:hypothetical protein